MRAPLADEEDQPRGGEGHPLLSRDARRHHVLGRKPRRDLARCLRCGGRLVLKLPKGKTFPVAVCESNKTHREEM